MVIPQYKTFLVKPIIFQGPCKSSNVSFQIFGNLVAPDAPSTWDGLDASIWLKFDSVNGLAFGGYGQLDGRGSNWWKQTCKLNPKSGCTNLAPNIVKFTSCNDIVVSGLKFVNSPQTHITFLNCKRVVVHNIRIISPDESPNTDGIHIHQSQNVLIVDSSIASGDDCISVGNFIYDVRIIHVGCGPGHGISIGSLGRNGDAASVDKVIVRNAIFYNTTNGARIKTWQGGKGFVRGIVFEGLTMNNVKNPIIIDQYYCDKKCPILKSAVKISDVKYIGIIGTSVTPAAISLNCSQSVACEGIHFENINITQVAPGQASHAVCNNAEGDTKDFIYPQVSCLL